MYYTDMNEKISYDVGVQHDTYGPFIKCGIFLIF